MGRLHFDTFGLSSPLAMLADPGRAETWYGAGGSRDTGGRCALQSPNMVQADAYGIQGGCWRPHTGLYVCSSVQSGKCVKPSVLIHLILPGVARQRRRTDPSC